MINVKRLERCLVLALVPFFVMAAIFASTPNGALSIAGSPGSSGARLYGTRAVIDGIGLSGENIAGVEVAHLDIGNLKALNAFVIERDFIPSSAIPGARGSTIRLEVPYVAAPDTIHLYSANTCLTGVGITHFGLLEGLVDGPLNSALANGYHPNFLTFLVNIIGPAGIIDITAKEMHVEFLRITTPTLVTQGGMALTITPLQTDPAFIGTCL